MDALADALTAVPGVALLDTEMDAAHNRCVITVAGDPEAIAQGAIEAVGKAVELIDLRKHRGEHPRMGGGGRDPIHPHLQCKYPGLHRRVGQGGSGHCGPLFNSSLSL